ncbi:MAG: hypothetical protein JO265_08235 [Acidimicrobiia bacterium]|nr:hypothetical protein [Acidimicrobiia bacterium]
MQGRTGRVAGVAIVLGVVLGMAGTAALPARAAGDLGGYQLVASAPALELVLDSDALPVPAHPALDATMPEASSNLEAGLGHGLASLVWPGDLAGHFGSALQQLGQLCSSTLPISIPGVPTECVPVPQALQSNASAFNDPVKAETFYPGGPADDQYNFTPPFPGVTMTSHADANRVESMAGFASFAAPGVMTLGSVTSHSLATAGGGTATSQATSELSNVALAGGLVTIDHLKSTATEVTDGQQATGTGTTVLSGLRIGGVPVSVDSNGLQVGSLSAAANQALHNLGLSIQLTTPDVLTDGAKGSFAAPALVISYRDDQNALEAAGTALGQQLAAAAPQQIAGSLQTLAVGPQAKVSVALGGVGVAVDGSPAFTSPVGDLTAPSTVSPAGLSSVATNSPSSSSAPSVAALTFGSALPATTSRAALVRPTVRATGFLAGFGGLAWGLVVAAVAAALALAFGLYRYALAADASGAARARADTAGSGCT